MSRAYLVLLVSLAAAFVVPASARGQLIQDGGFELAADGVYNGPLGDGWSVTSGQMKIFSVGNPNNIPAHGGIRSIDLDYSSAFNNLSQTVSTVPGLSYNIQFWLTADVPSVVTAKFGSQTLYSASPPSTGTLSQFTPFQLYSFNAVATTNLTAVSFSSTYTYSFPGIGAVLDDVSVAPVPVPEPEPASLAFLSLSGSVLLRRQKRRGG